MPTPTAGSNTPVCAGSTLNLTATGGSTYAWTGPNGFNSNIQNPTITNATTGASGSYTVTVTGANGCIANATTNVTINPFPTASVVSNQTYCNSIIAPVTPITGAVPGTAFIWTNSNPAIGLAASGSGNIPSFTATNTTNAPISATITITPSASGCTGTPVTYTIAVNPTPTTTAVSNQTHCSNASVAANSLSGPVAGTTFTWTNSNTAIGLAASGTGDIPSFTATNTTTAPITATITITPTANGCTGTSSTYTITVNPLPAVNAVSNAVYCNTAAGAAINFASNVPGATFAWTSSANVGFGTSGTGNMGAFTASNSTNVPAVATISVIATANGCAGAATTFTITVNPIPAITATPSTQTVCSGTAINTITISNPGNVAGTTYAWTRDNTGVLTGLTSGTGSTIAGTLTNTTNTAQSTIFTITSSASGCTSTTTATVIVSPRPVITNQTAAICSGGTFTVTPANGGSIIPAGTTYSWAAPTGTGLTGGSAGSGTSITGTLINTGTVVRTATYTVTPVSGSCTGSTFTVSVTVNPVPAIANQATTVCSGTAINITPSGVPTGTTYTWSAPSVTGGITGGTAGSGSSITGTITNTTGAVQTATYTVTPVTNGCTGNTFTVTATINPATTITTAPANITVCEGSSATFSVAATGLNLTYQWQVRANGNNFNNIAGATSATYTKSPVIESDENRYRVVITGSCGTANPTVELTVNPLPACSITGTNTVCPGISTTFTASGGGTYSWTGPNGFTAGTQNVTISDSGTYTVTVTNSNGCKTSCTRTLAFNPTPTITVTPASAAICSGTSTTLTASGATSFSWNPGTSLSSTVNATVVANPTTTTTYTVTGYNASGCYGSTTVTVTVTPEVVGGTLSPAVTNYCEGAANNGTLTLSGYTGPIVRWEASNDGGASWSTIANTGNTLNYSNLTQTTLYRAFLEDGPCSAYSGTAVVTITPLVPPTGVTASPAEICLGDSTTLTATASGYPPGWNTVQAFNSANLDQNEGWSATNNGASHNIQASADNEVTTPWNLTNPHTFNGIRYDNPDSDKFAIAAGAINTSIISAAFNTIGLSSATFNFQQAFNLGPGAVITVEISTDSGLTWHTEPLMKYTGPLNLGNPNQGWVTTSIDLSDYLGLENLKIRWNYQGTAGSNWAIDNAGIVPPPLPLIYNWTLTDPAGVPSPYYLNTTTGPTVNGSPTTPGTYTYTVSTTYGGCAGGSMNVPVVVKPLPVCDITGNNAVCPGSTNTYSAPAIDGYTYIWTISGGATISGAATGQTVTVVANNTCGIYTLTLTTSLNGCSSSTPCTLVVNVVDNTAPVATAPATQTFQCLADVPVPGTLTATDNCSGNITSTGVDVQVADGCGYIITRTWTFTDACNNTSSVSQIINVQDNTAPVVPAAPASQNFQCLVDVPAPGTLTATDNCSGDITATGVDVQVAKACGYTITRTWTFTDACNNTSSVSQIINVADDIPPVITCPPAQVFCIVNSNNYTIPPATASDNCSGAVNITYQITGATTRSGTGDDASGVFNVGVSTITWTATDVCGNISTCTSTVTINPKPAPIIYHN
ncbi:beta strand repeat-containing protein [Niastella populi]|uniref:beta strand repeat-containing protein n=1 Tax=Niastella populi TaxID=550983 RepID=UPI001A98C2C0|nr:PKD-like domain-containing protein [Niastella populi]